MRFKLALVTAGLLTASVVAQADAINVFTLNGTTSSGTLSGVVTLDATTGKFTDSAVKFLYTGATYSGLINGTTYNFAGAPVSTAIGTGYTSTDFGGTGAASLFAFDLSLPFTSLTGYTGGSLCSTTKACSTQVSALELLSGGVAYSQVTSGTLTLVQPTIAVTPEPSALVLLGTGVLGLGVLLRKRYV